MFWSTVVGVLLLDEKENLLVQQYQDRMSTALTYRFTGPTPTRT